MPFSQHVLTLDTTAQRLGTALGVTDSAKTKFGISVSLQPGAGNTGYIYVGDSGVTAAAYAFRLEIPVTSIPSAPYIFELGQGQCALDDFYVKSSVNGDKLHVGVMYT